MDATFKILETTRKIYISFLENYSLEQLNKIPEGFNNNLIWNIGHIIVSQQALVYRLSGLTMNISNEMLEKYKNGSYPDGKTTQNEVDEIKQLLTILIEKTKTDYQAGKFNQYQEYQTKLGFNLKNINDAMQFNNVHEGIHLGIMMSIKKFV